jgi:tetratricopeptide (TPR) repeat protein
MSALSTVKPGAIAAAVWSAIAVSTAQAGAETGAWCEKQWAVDSTVFVSKQAARPDYDGLLKKWELYRPKCVGTGAYEARWAMALALLGRIDEANAVLRTVENKETDYPYLVEAARLQIDTWDALRSPNDQKVRLVSIEKRYRALVKTHPSWLQGYGLLGSVQTVLEMHHEAIPNLERSRSADADTWGSFRNLTVSYAAVGRFSDALDAAGIALDSNSNVMSDADFMYAAAKSNLALGETKAARNVLQVLVSKRPAVRSDPDFARVLSLVAEQEQRRSTHVK